MLCVVSLKPSTEQNHFQLDTIQFNIKSPLRIRKKHLVQIRKHCYTVKCCLLHHKMSHLLRKTKDLISFLLPFGRTTSSKGWNAQRSPSRQYYSPEVSCEFASNGEGKSTTKHRTAVCASQRPCRTKRWFSGLTALDTAYRSSVVKRCCTSLVSYGTELQSYGTPPKPSKLVDIASRRQRE